MTLLEKARVLARAWSVQIAVIGAALMAGLLALDPVTLQGAWQSMPAELRGLIPAHLQTWVTLALFVGVAITRAAPQPHVDRRLGLLQTASADRKAWRAAAAAPLLRRIDGLVVHCSATPEGKPFFAGDIRRWHKAKGWSDIGYHFVVDLDGVIEVGRPIATAGAHVAGHNASTIGICYIGGVAADGVTPRDTRTPAQKAALDELLRVLAARFPAARIVGHRDFPDVAKACPSFDARAEYAGIAGPSKARPAAGALAALALALILPLSGCVTTGGRTDVVAAVERADAAYTRIRAAAELALPLLPPSVAVRVRVAMALADQAVAAARVASSAAEQLRQMRALETQVRAIADAGVAN